jgi:hypothetical protein
MLVQNNKFNYNNRASAFRAMLSIVANDNINIVVNDNGGCHFARGLIPMVQRTTARKSW